MAVSTTQTHQALESVSGSRSANSHSAAVEQELMANPSTRTNSAPLCLIAFAVVTFMFSLVNVTVASGAVVPVIIGTGLIFGGVTQLVGGLILIRAGDTFNGTLFSTFGAFWAIFAAYLQWFSKAVPVAQAGHAAGLLLYTFAIVAGALLMASFRTTVATVLALSNLVVTLLLLGTGNYAGNATLLHIGGATGIVLAGQALYLAAAQVYEYAYGKTVIPLGKLSI
jgi:succinate-acetate transporter protein